MCFRAHLAEINDSWQEPGQAALNELNRVLTKHECALEPLCSIAARLNPTQDPGVLFAREELVTVEGDVMNGLAAFARSSPPRPAPAPPIPVVGRQKLDFASFVGFAKIRRSGNQQPVSSGDPLRDQWSQYNQDAASIRRDATPSDHFDALDYWLGQQDRWPELTGYAVSILARPIASTATERHFSRTVQIEGLRRVSLTPEHVQELALLMSNQSIAETVIK
jgi:hypothetical protein